MPHKSGFTLIELLLVILIIGVISGISVPSFVRSIQGNRLRSAARMVASAGRYARSMAVLHQRPVAITFDRTSGTMVVDLAASRQPANDTDVAGIEPLVNMDAGTPEDGMRSSQAGDGGSDDPAIRIERKLDGVSIDSVRFDDLSYGRGELEAAGERMQVMYASNGRCEAHSIVLVDNDGLQLVVAVDALGGAKIEER